MIMHLSKIPPGFYRGLQEMQYELAPNIFIVNVILVSDKPEDIMGKYVIRVVSPTNTYEAMIPYSVYEGILGDRDIKTECRMVSRYEYLYGKDTVYVYQEGIKCIYAEGPEDNKEWQYDFHKYHIQGVQI